jgi:NAD+ kinase
MTNASTNKPRALLLSSGERAEIVAEASRLASLACEYLNVEAADLDCVGNLENVDFDLAIVVGGDGSILRASHLMGRRQRPVVGVNLGRLGFLADLSPGDFLRHLPVIASLELPVVKHLMLDCRLLRGGQTVCQQLGLNEVTVFAGPPFAILEIDLYVDSELATTYSCDGLIVSTPVGSTAHNLSAGGPILRKNLQAIVISPISPHTLTNRPVIDAASRVYELQVRRPHPGTTLVCDGKTMSLLVAGDRVRVSRADVTFDLVATPGHSYYRSLRDKLGWGGQLRFNGGSQP